MNKAPSAAFTSWSLKIIPVLSMEPGELASMVMMQKTLIKVNRLIPKLSKVGNGMQIRMTLLTNIGFLSQ